MGPRLRAAREQHGATLAGVSRATGISAGTLSRIETGRRKPTLEVLLQLSKEYGVSLDEPAGTAPAPAAEPRATAPLSFGDDKVVLPLTRYVGGLHAHKHVLPALADPPERPRQVSHDGCEWLCVLYGRLWLALGGHDLVLTPGGVAESDTRTPHGVANTGPGTPVEYLVMVGPQGERLRPRTPPAYGRAPLRPPAAQAARRIVPGPAETTTTTVLPGPDSAASRGTSRFRARRMPPGARGSCRRPRERVLTVFPAAYEAGDLAGLVRLRLVFHRGAGSASSTRSRSHPRSDHRVPQGPQSRHTPARLSRQTRRATSSP